jgi:hypothetical protein
MLSNNRLLIIKSALHEIEYIQGHRLIDLLDMAVEFSYTSSKWKSFALLLKTLVFFPSKLYLLLSKTEPTSQDKINVLVCTSSSNERLTSFFKGLEYSDQVMLTYAYPINSVGSSNSGTLLKVQRHILSIWLLKSILRLKAVSLFEKIEIIRLIIIQNSIFLTWQRVLINNKYSTLLCDLDRYPSNAPIVLAAKSLSIKNATIIHGSTTPITNYLPVIANNILVWGEYHQEQFERNIDPNRTKIWVIGNPKIKLPNEKKPEDISINTIGLATTPLPLQIYKSVLSVFEKGTKNNKRIIKAHPIENESNFAEYRDIKNLCVFYNESVDYFLSHIDVLCVRNSQLGSDALGYRIPIIIIDTQDGYFLQNGELLNKNAGCPIVQNANQLALELEQLKRKSYYEARVNKQLGFFERLFTYIGSDSDKEFIKFVQKSF